MKISRKWINRDFVDLTHISDQQFIEAMEHLGHRVLSCHQIDEHGTILDNPPIASYDTIIDLEISANRPDCHSMIGIAREAAAAFNIPMKLSVPVVRGSDSESIYEHLDVDIAAEWLCNRYSVRMARNIKVAPSPKWLSDRLSACGIQPVNNIVDIIHYVHLEYGLPVLAYDYRGIASGTLMVREAEEGESIPSSNGCPHPLESGMAVVADAIQPIRIIGNTVFNDVAISDDTTDIVFEAAHYNYEFFHNAVLTDAAYQQDALMTVPTLERVCELVELLQCGEVLDGIIDILNYVPDPLQINYDMHAISAFLPFKPSSEQVIAYLKRLEIFIDGDTITIPSFRQDLKSLKDIALEISRLYSLSNICKK